MELNKLISIPPRVHYVGLNQKMIYFSKNNYIRNKIFNKIFFDCGQLCSYLNFYFLTVTIMSLTAILDYKRNRIYKLISIDIKYFSFY